MPQWNLVLAYELIQPCLPLHSPRACLTPGDIWAWDPCWHVAQQRLESQSPVLPPQLLCGFLVNKDPPLPLAAFLYITHRDAKPSAWHVKVLNKYIFYERLNE